MLGNFVTFEGNSIDLSVGDYNDISIIDCFSMRKIAVGKNIILLLLAVLLITSFEANAQKKRRKDKNKKEEPKEVYVVSDEDRAKAELYHVEAEKYYILEDYPKSYIFLN